MNEPILIIYRAVLIRNAQKVGILFFLWIPASGLPKLASCRDLLGPCVSYKAFPIKTLFTQAVVMVWVSLWMLTSQYYVLCM